LSGHQVQKSLLRVKFIWVTTSSWIVTISTIISWITHLTLFFSNWAVCRSLYTWG
jgi:hypothetical protein